MPVIVIAAAAAIALSIPLLIWSIASASADRKTARASLAALSGLQDLREVVLTRSAQERAVTPLVRNLAARARRLTPTGFVDSLERRLALAGRPPAWPIEKVLAGKVVLGLFAALMGFLFFTSGPSVLRLCVWVLMAALGYFAPDLLLYSRGMERQQAIQGALPDVLDQMTICVEAGLGFEAAMARAGRSGKGPLADELVRTLQEMQVGVTRGVALRNLAERSNVADLRYFVTAIVQAESYGIPVADVLRSQAGELRVKRRQRAEERAMKIPVKIVFPLVFCILPSLFIVILGPAAIRIYENIVRT